MSSPLFVVGLFLAVIVAAGAIALLFWGVTLANRAIGQGYLMAAQGLERSLSGRVLYAEDDVPLRTLSHAYIAAAARWRHCHVRVTPGIVYLLQYQMRFGKPMGQPSIAIVLDRQRQADALRTDVRLILKSPVRSEAGDAHLACEALPFGSMTIRLRLRDPARFLQALERVVPS